MVLQQQEILAPQKEVLHHPKEPVPTAEPTKAEKRAAAEKAELVKSWRWIGKVANKIKKKAAVEKASIKAKKRAAVGRLAVEKAVLKLAAERTADKKLVNDKAASENYTDAEKANKKVQTAANKKSSLNKLGVLNPKERGDESNTFDIQHLDPDKKNSVRGENV